MLHDEESPEKPQYNMATPLDKPTSTSILPNTPFSSKNFQIPPFPSILKKLNPPFMKGGGVRTMNSSSSVDEEEGAGTSNSEWCECSANAVVGRCS